MAKKKLDLKEYDNERKAILDLMRQHKITSDVALGKIKLLELKYGKRKSME